MVCGILMLFVNFKRPFWSEKINFWILMLKWFWRKNVKKYAKTLIKNDFSRLKVKLVSNLALNLCLVSCLGIQVKRPKMYINDLYCNFLQFLTKKINEENLINFSSLLVQRPVPPQCSEARKLTVKTLKTEEPGGWPRILKPAKLKFRKFLHRLLPPHLCPGE